MNLRIDLILESEQRSASVLSLKLMRRLALIAVPVLLGLIVVFSVLGTMRMGMRATDLETQWRILEPQRDAALERSRQVARHRAILHALESWPETKLTLHEQLAVIMAIVPETIQITQFNYVQTISHAGRDRARETNFLISGRARGSDATESRTIIERLEDLFRTTEPFATLVKSVTMSGRADTSEDALETDRRFDIECEYHPRPFKP